MSALLRDRWPDAELRRSLLCFRHCLPRLLARQHALLHMRNAIADQYDEPR